MQYLASLYGNDILQLRRFSLRRLLYTKRFRWLRDLRQRNGTGTAVVISNSSGFNPVNISRLVCKKNWGKSPILSSISAAGFHKIYETFNHKVNFIVSRVNRFHNIVFYCSARQYRLPDSPGLCRLGFYKLLLS